MRYVGGDHAETGCIFCNRLAGTDDRRSVILHRDDGAFIIMNLYPYNTGHCMIVPNQHTASPEDADPAGMAAMSRLRPALLRALRRALNCQGFNLGMNVGTVAGAGVADHLHEHVVPRWVGDANFMPIVANTTVMPEVIPVTYAKVRAELVREIAGTSEAVCSLLAANRRLVLTDQNGQVPRVPLPPGQSAWRSVLEAARDLTGSDVELLGWVGTGPAGDAAIQLQLRVVSDSDEPTPPQPGWHWTTLSEAKNEAADPLLATAPNEQVAERSQDT
jgi:ATP adenylyltransferase